MMGNIILTGDRPTGRLHLGHYVGSLKNRVKLQDALDYDKMYIMVADAQALTDNFNNPQKVRDNVIEVMLDYLSVGLDPKKVIFFVQSEVSELTELTFYYMNLVTLSRLKRNPTVKNEMEQKGFDKSIPMGFLNYPVSQTADITAFKANLIPVGEDQLPMIEQAREIVRSFNGIYGETLHLMEPLLPDSELERRLPGLDGNSKMSKSLGNCIYLADSSIDVKKKVMSMYTDPLHINIEDPGHIEGNMVFTYLDVFASDDAFSKYMPEYTSLDELKEAYQKGGVGDAYIKKFLYNVLEEFLAPIRKKRKYYEEHIELVYDILKEGTKVASIEAGKTLQSVKKAMKINYFEDEEFKKEVKSKYSNK